MPLFSNDARPLDRDDFTRRGFLPSLEEILGRRNAYNPGGEFIDVRMPYDPAFFAGQTGLGGPRKAPPPAKAGYGAPPAFPLLGLQSAPRGQSFGALAPLRVMR